MGKRERLSNSKEEQAIARHFAIQAKEYIQKALESSPRYNEQLSSIVEELDFEYPGLVGQLDDTDDFSTLISKALGNIDIAIGKEKHALPKDCLRRAKKCLQPLI